MKSNKTYFSRKSRKKGSWKSSWQEIDGKRCYFRSSWEVKYANYLQKLKEDKKIIDWEFEADTFWFDRIKRGVRSYLPDFKITFPDNSVEYHEVKGWMDARSKTKIKRMKIYHPDIKLVVIQKKDLLKLGIAV